MVVAFAKFPMGQLTATRGMIDKMAAEPDYFRVCICKHLAGDWGDLGEEDKRINNYSLKHGMRLLSAYPLPNDPDRFWIITEADRSVTTLLLPDEY